MMLCFGCFLIPCHFINAITKSSRILFEFRLILFTYLLWDVLIIWDWLLRKNCLLLCLSSHILTCSRLHSCCPCEAHITLTRKLAAEILGVSSKTAECHFQTCGGIFLQLPSVPVACCCCWASWVWISCLCWVKAPEGRAETAERVDLNAEFQDV